MIPFFSTSNRVRHRHILSLAAPAVVALLAEPMLGIVDTALVGHLGVTELGALAVATTFLASIVWLFSFLMNATTSSIAIFLGKGEVEQAGRFYFQSQLLALGLGLAMGLAAWITEPLVFALMGATEEMREVGRGYYLLRLAGIPFAFSNFVSVGYLRGAQDMKSPMLVAVTISVTNALLDAILIYGIDGVVPAYGLPGAAAATVLCQAGAAAWSFGIVRLRHRVHGGLDALLRPDRALYGRMFRINRDLFFRTFSLLFSLAFATAMATRMGEYVVGAHQVAMQLWLFCAFAMDSFAISGQTVAGNLKGRGDWKELRIYGKLLTVWGIVAGLLFGTVLLVGNAHIARLFSSDEKLIELTLTLLPLLVIIQPLNGIVFVLDGILIGVLDTRFLMLQLIVAGLLVFVPIAFASYHFDWGLTGLWTGLAAFLVTRLLFNGYRFVTRGYEG